MNKPNRPGPKAQGKPQAKPQAKPVIADAKNKPKTHVATDASRRRQHNAHAASETMDEGEELIRQLAALAGAVARSEADPAGERVGQQELERMIRKCLRQRDDETLYEALEHLRFEDRSGYALLRQAVEDAADIVVLRKGEKEMEINAFVIPLLARTRGGLHADRALADADAFDTLRTSLQESGLESERAKVVLVHHLYHPEEIDALSYSDVEAMNRDAFASLTDKKVMAAPAIERSMRGWPASSFSADDEALELRFLLGFALKNLDDPFYAIPADEEQADAYFEARAGRFRLWTEKHTPLMQRCLTGAEGEAAQCELHFLYQDLFHGGKQTGHAEYRTLQLMSELEQGLEEAGAAPEQVVAVLAASEVDGELLLHVQLRAADRELVRTATPIDGDPHEQLADAADAITTLGITQFKLADGFDANGTPLRERAFTQD